MSTYPFLSDAWINEARAIREKFRNEEEKKVPKVRVNFVVNDVPAEVSSESSLDGHFDTSEGEPEIELGHLDKADVSVTGPYEIMRSVFVEGNINRALEAMQLGRLKINGNMFKLMGLAKLKNDPTIAALLKEIQAITA